MALLHVLRVVLASALLFTSVSGQCTSPKVRKEWRQISSDERTAWIHAIKCLAELPHDPNIQATVDPTLSLIPPLNTSSTYWDDFVYAHMDLNVLIHQTGYFFPWHRLYVQTLEDQMRLKCGYEGVHPYWDWTIDAPDFEHATIFSNSTDEGLGYWGDPDNDYQIFTGGFENITVAYPVPHNIRRNFTLQPFLNTPTGALPVDSLYMVNTSFTASNVNFTISSFNGDFVSFQTYVESIAGPHPAVHIILGGDMSGLCPFGLSPPNCYSGQKWSSSDPMFYLHHAMIDKVWYDWQLQDPNNTNAFGGGTVSIQVDPAVGAIYPTGGPPFLNLTNVIPSDGFWGNITIGDVMNTTAGVLCYTYA